MLRLVAASSTTTLNDFWENILKQMLCLAALVLGACQQQQVVRPSALAPESRGHAFAQASCAACHAVERDSIVSPNPRAPSFPSIANQQGLTKETLSSWLRDAHNYPSDM